MNADGTPGIAVSMTIGAKSGLIAPLAVVLTLLGVVLTTGAVVLIVYGVLGLRERSGTDGTAESDKGVAPAAPSSGVPLPPPDTLHTPDPDSHSREVLH